MRTDILERKEEILSWIAEEKSINEILKLLKCKYVTLMSYFEKMGISYIGHKGKTGKRKNNLKYTSVEDYVHNSTCIKSWVLKEKLIAFGVKKHQCEICKLVTWNEQEIPLELHHVDGNHFNNELYNLQLLCPNCHAQMENNSGKAVGNYSKDSLHSLKTTTKAKVRGLSESVWQERKNLILTQAIDFTKFGWKTKAVQLTGLTMRQVQSVVKHYPEDFQF